VKRITIFSLVVFLLSGVLAATETRYDGRLLSREVTYTLHADGSWSRELRHRMQYNSHNATRRMGETFILFNPDFQELSEIESVTTMKDGTRVPLPENALNLVLPRVAHEHPGFSHLREMVVTHTGLERGAVVDFSYRLHTRADFQPGFAATEPLADALPIDRLVIRVQAESGRRVCFAAPFELPVQKASGDGKETWTWVLENIPPACAESSMPADQLPELILGENQDWQKVLEPIRASGPLPAELLKQVEETVRETIAVADRVVMIGRLVDKGIDLCRVPLTLSGWRFRSPEEVWNLHSATAPEKARLLQAALKAAGLPAEILVFSNRGWIDAEGPVLPQAQRFLVEVRESDTRAWYLDPLNESATLFPYALEGRVAYRAVQDRFERLFNPLPTNHDVEVSGEVNIDAARNSTGWLEVRLTGACTEYKTAMDDAAAAAESALKRLLPLKKMRIEAIRELTPSSLRARFKVEAVALEQLADSVFAFRQPRINHVNAMMVAPAQRVSPLVFPHSLHVRVSIAVQTAEEVRLQTAKASLIEHGSAVFSHSSRIRDRGVTVLTWEFTLPTRVETAQYAGFRKLVGRVLDGAPWFTLIFPPQK
jgi:hypothetical protein